MLRITEQEWIDFCREVTRQVTITPELVRRKAGECYFVLRPKNGSQPEVLLRVRPPLGWPDVSILFGGSRYYDMPPSLWTDKTMRVVQEMAKRMFSAAMSVDTPPAPSDKHRKAVNVVKDWTAKWTKLTPMPPAWGELGNAPVIVVRWAAEEVQRLGERIRREIPEQSLPDGWPLSTFYQELTEVLAAGHKEALTTERYLCSGPWFSDRILREQTPLQVAALSLVSILYSVKAAVLEATSSERAEIQEWLSGKHT